MTVFFIGAGPGDPELITVKGQRLLRQCPVILYAGSLVPEAVLAGHVAEEVVDTADLDLEQIIERLAAADARGQDVARVHSGDPSLFGAIGEQIRALQARGIAWEIIPGVTAASASAAALGCELTLPGISQTVILTRHARKTTMPAGESLPELARHGATLAIHLAIRHQDEIVAILQPEYGAYCPVAVVYRSSWPDQRLVRCRLDDIVARVAEAPVERTALILVGQVLSSADFARSTLYA